jgi:transposase-like protein
MKLYHEGAGRVKGSIQVLDLEALRAKASEGLLKLSVDLGLEVIRQMLEEDATDLAGEKGKHQKGRRAYRHGYEQTKVVCGGEKLTTSRPRVRSKEGDEELALPSLSAFQAQDPLNQAILSHLLAGVSTRKYARTQDEPSGSCMSKSEVSRRFVKEMKAAMETFFARRLEDDFVAIMIDGMGFDKITIVAAMGITADGKKKMLGIAEGGSENAEVVKSLLADLVGRGLDPARPRLYVLDGGKALHKAVTDTFGKNAVIQRCQVHKKRNVLAQLPESEKANVSIKLTNAYREFDYSKAKSALEKLANELAFRYPKAADSLREGLEETLTVHRLGIPGLLRQTLSNTNPMESANSICAGIVRKVSRFKDGETALRHAAAGFIEAERGFHRVNGYRQIPFLLNALEALTADEKHVILSA